MKTKASIFDSYPMHEFDCRAAFRNWLEQNHNDAPGIWVRLFKVKSGVPSVRYPEVVQECLCFGWIDTKMQPLDEISYRQVICPRKPKSVWSRLNKDYIESLKAEGLMTKAGQKVIDEAIKDGSWTRLDLVEALVVPPDLQLEFDSQPATALCFEKLSPGQKKQVLYRLGLLKGTESRNRRIRQILQELSDRHKA